MIFGINEQYLPIFLHLFTYSCLYINLPINFARSAGPEAPPNVGAVELATDIGHAPITGAIYGVRDQVYSNWETPSLSGPLREPNLEMSPGCVAKNQS